MALKTRLDGRSDKNRSFDIKNRYGEVLATIIMATSSSTTLEVVTASDLYIEKPSGWNSLGAKHDN